MRTRRASVALLLALALMLPTSCAKEGTTRRKSVGTVRIAYSTSTNASVMHIALAKKYFEEEGLEVQSAAHASGKLCLEAVLQGNADFATVAETPIIFAILEGADLRITAVIESSDLSTGVVADLTKGIATPEDLRGKRIGVTLGTTSEYFLDTILRAHGLGYKDIRMVDMQPGELADAIARGKIDAAVTWEPNLGRVADRLGTEGKLFYERTLFTDFFCIASLPDYADVNPELTRAFLKALIRAETFLRESPAEATKLVSVSAGIKEDQLPALLGKYDYSVLLDQSLLIALEDEARWIISEKLRDERRMPNFLEYIDAGPLKAVKADRVRLIK